MLCDLNFKYLGSFTPVQSGVTSFLENFKKEDKVSIVLSHKLAAIWDRRHQLPQPPSIGDRCDGSGFLFPFQLREVLIGCFGSTWQEYPHLVVDDLLLLPLKGKRKRGMVARGLVIFFYL
uniref:uncharacterized protein LOC122579450 isoform X3 n=1 Tax=Erigeron canadensis TaxID=72917 RepID=UPI001CB96F73|nr:uncharacterized protein LOC122579450 isoform X3 [Erigeron canadensis]